MRINVSSLIGFALLSVLLAGSDALAKAKVIPTKIKGSGSATFVIANFSYDGNPNPNAVQLTGTGKDNFGTFTIQGVAEYSTSSSGTCVAPDSSTGAQYDLVASNWVFTYNSTYGQIFLSAGPSATNNECVSDSSIKFGGTTTYIAKGGSDQFKTASGTFTETFIGETLAAPGAPGNGTFSAYQFQSAGSVIK